MITNKENGKKYIDENGTHMKLFKSFRNQKNTLQVNYQLAIEYLAKMKEELKIN